MSRQPDSVVVDQNYLNDIKKQEEIAAVDKKFSDLEKEFETLKGKAARQTDNLRKDMAERLSELRKEIENLSRAV